MEIHPFQESLLPELVALHNTIAPARRHTSAAMLKETLTDSPRAGGSNVRVLFGEGKIAGFAAWVEGSSGEFFGSPVIAANEKAAQVAVAVLLEQAKRKNWIRVSAFPEETVKTEALKRNGFSPLFEFVEFEIRPERRQDIQVPAGILDRSVTSMSPLDFLRLHNDSFEGVDNALPIKEKTAEEILFSPLLDPDLSRAWFDESGNAVAFSLANQNGYLDAIGVVPGRQREGLGVKLYELLLSRAAEKGVARVYTTVSSRNEGSLRLHRRLQIPEVERRVVWERKLR